MEFLDKLRQALMSRRTQYVRTFGSPPGKEVLKDLVRFCRGNESTFHENPHVAARLDGRREVLLRIQHHLRLSPDELWELYSGRPSRED